MGTPLIIIPTYISKEEHQDLLGDCVSSIRDRGIENEVMLVDDFSPYEGTPDFLHNIRNDYKDITIINKGENEGFSKTVNVGLYTCLEEKRDAILCNSDIEFIDGDWLEELLNTEGDIVGARLLYPNGTIQHAGVYFSPISRSFDHRFHGAPGNLPIALESEECPVTAALQLIRWKVLEEVGLYDESFKMGFEDVDFQISAIEAGFKCIYNPKVKAIHHEHAFRGEKSEKLEEWQIDSLGILISKHKDKSFFGMLPTMHE